MRRKKQLVYSPDDKGWYWQRFSDWKTSQIFETMIEAIEAARINSLTWE